MCIIYLIQQISKLGLNVGGIGPRFIHTKPIMEPKVSRAINHFWQYLKSKKLPFFYTSTHVL